MAKANSRRTNWKWYGVKSLYRWVALGKPKNPDSSYVPGATLVEERIVLFKARSPDEAHRKATKEGRDYARSIRFTNGYGQKVQARMLKEMDVYEFDLPLGPGTEVFSSTEAFDVSVPDERICQRLIGWGEESQEDPFLSRKKFINVQVFRMILEHLPNNSPSCCAGKEHGR